jgi:hypothetical protein
MYLKAFGIYEGRLATYAESRTTGGMEIYHPPPTVMRNTNAFQPTLHLIGDNHAVCTYRLT